MNVKVVVGRVLLGTAMALVLVGQIVPWGGHGIGDSVRYDVFPWGFKARALGEYESATWFAKEWRTEAAQEFEEVPVAFAIVGLALIAASALFMLASFLLTFDRRSSRVAAAQTAFMGSAILLAAIVFFVWGIHRWVTTNDFPLEWTWGLYLAVATVIISMSAGFTLWASDASFGIRAVGSMPGLTGQPLSCPRCKTPVIVHESRWPTCPTCGHGSGT